MAVTVEAVKSITPDQASLKAAAKLMKLAKWPLVAEDPNGSLIWAECQGLGANPYRVAADKNDLGYTCTYPSRKFPCKYALTLMWFKAENNASFQSGAPPEWVLEWVGRSRNTAAANKNLKVKQTADKE